MGIKLENETFPLFTYFGISERNLATGRNLATVHIETTVFQSDPTTKHRNAKRARLIFVCVCDRIIGAFLELFTVMIWLSFFGCDVLQERNLEFMMSRENEVMVS